ncbi:glycosyl transferase family 2 [[Leptolyngbya] sp. PCC 7376]|uniref:glycosyltransferase family 2 protein n=1 Tax=[Leptolyngbya] sp. PCC 7376 TaxID=111781 RepID=UPI00029F176C|nr:glycosyltransferase family 2 protein [[Leptolyngbya] sp. PCC 7376]AFY37497.1 glycosyl transferase family 2 [[Leptolyngbya] sp. PCC 7376]
MNDRLSLCMIVKNEADILAECLRSVQDVVSEIVILDTGSTDDTVAIAESFGAVIGHYEWSNDFAAARNEALKLVTKEWVLVLDADEKLNEKAIEDIEKAITEPDTLAVNLVRYEIGAAQSPYSLVSRLFRMHPAIKFERPYHAMIDDSVAELLTVEPQWQIKDLSTIAIFHTGYQREAIAKLEKSTRAKQAMEAYFKAHKNDPYVCSKLGAIYIYEGLAKQGLKTLKQGLKCSANASPNLLYELHYHLGNAFRKQGETDKAIKHYNQAIEQPIINKLKIGAHHNLGALLQTLGKAEEAIAQHQTTVVIDPTFAAGHYHMGMAYKAVGKVGEAITAYEQCLKYDPYNPWVHQNLAAILYRIGQIEESTKFFKQAIALHDEQNPQEAAKLRAKLKDLISAPL